MLWHLCHCNGTGFDSVETVSGDRSDRSSVHYSIGKKLQLCKVLKVMTRMLVSCNYVPKGPKQAKLYALSCGSSKVGPKRKNRLLNQ
jgi:hypothetical protein